MESIVELNELFDSFWILFELKVKITNLTSNRLRSFEYLLRNGSYYCFVFIFEYLSHL